MVFADGRVISKLEQLESELALLQDTVADLKQRLAALESDPVVDALRDSLVEAEA